MAPPAGFTSVIIFQFSGLLATRFSSSTQNRVASSPAAGSVVHSLALGHLISHLNTGSDDKLKSALNMRSCFNLCYCCCYYNIISFNIIIVSIVNTVSNIVLLNVLH